MNYCKVRRGSSPGTWSPVDFVEIAVDPASVGDVRHPASCLANCRRAVLTLDILQKVCGYGNQLTCPFCQTDRRGYWPTSELSPLFRFDLLVKTSIFGSVPPFKISNIRYTANWFKILSKVNRKSAMFVTLSKYPC